MSDPLIELRAEVAAEHGLPPEAAALVSGTTLTELEASAGRLAELVGASPAGSEQEQEPIVDLFSGAAAAKAQRKQQLQALFSGRPLPQPRDQGGRYARAAGFDGGARTPPPTPRNPERDHGQLIAELAAVSRTFRG